MARRTPPSSSGSRAFHQKTRHGCKRCKERRVKCSMQRPICNHCLRRNETCSYLGDCVETSYTSAVRHALPIVEFTVDSSPQGLVYRIPVSQPVLVSTLLRQIMNELRPATALEMQLWRASLESSSPFDSPFLWHSLSALHLLEHGRSNTKPEVQSKALEIAYHHHITASITFGSITPIVTEQNWPVFLSFGISIMVCQLAMQSICPEPFFDYVEMFQVLRTSRDIDRSLKGYLMSSKMWPLIRDRTALKESEKPHDHGLQDALKLLDIAIEDNTYMVPDDRCLHDAMARLKNWIRLCEGYPRRWGHYIHWPAVVDTRFIDAMRAGDPLSLVLLLHWIAILKLAPPRWFLETWLNRTAECVLGQLSSEWDELKAWPAFVMHAGRND